MERLGYWVVIIAGLVGLLSMLLSWLWHRLDQQLPDPDLRQEPWTPMQWAQYQNRARLMRIVQNFGVLAMYASLAGALVGFILIGAHGLRS